MCFYHHGQDNSSKTFFEKSTALHFLLKCSQTKCMMIPAKDSILCLPVGRMHVGGCVVLLAQVHMCDMHVWACSVWVLGGARCALALVVEFGSVTLKRRAKDYKIVESTGMMHGDECCLFACEDER